MNILQGCPLFAEIEAADVGTILDCLAAFQKEYERHTFICRAEESIDSVGILISGKVHTVQDDFWGNRRILAQIEPGGLFGELCGETRGLPFSVLAVEKSKVLYIDYKRIITLCSSVCLFHTRLIRNMLRIIAEENTMLIQKIEHLSRPTTREKLCSYLSAQARRAGERRFVIPFNRQELADYLGVDRSAMSHELCKMRDQGILRFNKNHFTLSEAAHNLTAGEQRSPAKD